MANLNLVAPRVDLTFQRGDTIRWTFTILNPSTPIDVTGYSFLLTVDPSSAPVNSSMNLFQLSGVLLDAPNGIVQFSMSPTQSDQVPGEYFYDLQMTDVAGSIRTIAKGSFSFEQDITK